MLCLFDVYEPVTHATRVAVRPPAGRSTVHVSDCLQFHADPIAGRANTAAYGFAEAWLTSMCQSIAMAILAHFVAFHAAIERAARRDSGIPVNRLPHHRKSKDMFRAGISLCPAVADERERLRAEHWMWSKRKRVTAF